MKKTVYIAIALLIIFSACSESKKNSAEAPVKRIVEYARMNYEPLDSTSTKLDLVISYDFGNELILGDNTIGGLQATHNNIFEGEKLVYAEGVDTFVVFQLNYKDSYIKIYHNDFTGTISDTPYDLSSDDLVSAVILDPEIQMQNGIHIGMSKSDFYEKILGRAPSQSIDTVQMGDEMGDREHQFIFQNDTLSRVLSTSSYEFTDFSFHHQ